MAWTTPRTWVAGELVTAAIGNSAWRDNLLYLKDAPTFDGAVTITGNLTLTAALVSNSATDSTSTLTGAIQTDGGLGVVKALWVGGLANIAGAVTLQSTLGVTGAITSAASVALTGTTNNVGTITSGVWNAGAITTSGAITSTSSGPLFTRSGASTAAQYFTIANTTGGLFFGVDNSAGGGLATGTPAYATVLSSPGATAISFGTSGAERVRVHASGGVSIGDGTDPGDNNLGVSGTIQATGQPGFLAYNSVSDTTLSGAATIDFDTEIYDTLGNFSSDTFTAPVAGKYLFTWCVRVSAAVNNTEVGSYLSTTTTFYQGSTANVPSGNVLQSSGSVILDMAASDTAKILLSLGSGTATVQGSSSPYVTYFCGRLLA